TLPGPVVFVHNQPFFTVVRPLDRNRVLIVFLEASRAWDELKQESEVWHIKTSIYDYDKHALFASFEGVVPPASLDNTIKRAHKQDVCVLLSSPGKFFLPLCVTFHSDPASFWFFLIPQRSAWTYSPVFLFIVSLFGVLAMPPTPFAAAVQVRKESTAQALA